MRISWSLGVKGLGLGDFIDHRRQSILLSNADETAADKSLGVDHDGGWKLSGVEPVSDRSPGIDEDWIVDPGVFCHLRQLGSDRR